MESKINILVIGGGMYVCGIGTNSYGTIMPALLEGRRDGLVGKLGIVTTSRDSAGSALKQIVRVAELMGVDKQCEIYPKTGKDEKAYLQAAEEFNPDAVIVSVPDHLHATISISLIEKGMHCLVAKPMASTVEEARTMIEAAQIAQVVTQVEFHKRLDESNILMHDAVQSGKLGKLLYAVIEYSQQKRIPRDIFRSWSAKSSVFQYLGVHYVDLLQFVTGFRPLRVSAWGQKDYLVRKGIDTWDAMQVVVEWKRKDGGQFVSTHITNWVDPDETSAMSDQKINIVGTQGRYQADQKNRGVQLVRDGIGVQDINPYFTSSAQDPAKGYLTFGGYGIKSVLRFIGDVQAYQSGRISLDELESNRPGFRNCLVSTAVVEAAHQSLNNQSLPVGVSL